MGPVRRDQTRGGIRTPASVTRGRVRPRQGCSGPGQRAQHRAGRGQEAATPAAASWQGRQGGRFPRRTGPGRPVQVDDRGLRRERGGVLGDERVRDAAVLMAGASAVRRAGGWRSSSRARSGGAGTTEAGAARGRSRRPVLRRAAPGAQCCGDGSWQVRSVRAAPARCRPVIRGWLPGWRRHLLVPVVPACRPAQMGAVTGQGTVVHRR